MTKQIKQNSNKIDLKDVQKSKKETEFISFRLSKEKCRFMRKKKINPRLLFEKALEMIK